MIKIRGSSEKILDLVQSDRNFDKFETSTKTYWSSGDSSILVMISKQVLKIVSVRRFLFLLFLLKTLFVIKDPVLVQVK